MRSGYFDLSWFLRAARVLPVIAGAALLGGMVGGFAVFAIDSALTWEPLTREPVSQPRPDARADSQTSAVVAQTKPVRIVGGAIPDPSAGMSAPPPAPQQRSAAPPAQSPAQISPQLLTPKPLGPASRLQTATAGPAAPQEQKQEQNQTTNQLPVPTQAASITQQSTQQQLTQQPTTQQPTRWPDALSRAHQNAANAANAESANSAQQQAAPPHGSDRAASADDQDRANTFRHGRHGRRHWRGEDDAWASSSRRQDARSYDRLYDSYGNRRDRSYSNTREQPYGDARGDQNDAASRSDLSRAEMRRSYMQRFGRDARYQNRSQPEDNDRNQASEANRPRPEPFWGGGSFFRRGNAYQDDD